MRLFKLIVLIGLFLPAAVTGFAPNLQIKAASESSWYNADLKDVQAVLDSTALAISPYIGTRSLEPIIVRNEEKGPIALYERGPNNEYIVLLDVKGRYWSQLSYQFAHETCHLLTNFDLAPNNVTHQQWFEESLCEAFSLFALEKMAAQWETQPPYPNWKDYAPEMTLYLRNILQQEHRSFTTQLGSWYRQHRATLEQNPYADDRQLNEKMASHLLAIFKRQPESWAAINYINLGEDSDDKSLEKYLNDWYQNTPENLRQPIVDIQQMLGIGRS